MTTEPVGASLKLVYIYQPIEDVAEAVAFHRDRLRLDEAWRDGENTVAYWLPDRSAQLMLSTTKQPPGPMYRVGSLDAWIRDHPEVVATVEKYAIPGGSVAGFAAPGGNIFYVFDQPDA